MEELKTFNSFFSHIIMTCTPYRISWIHIIYHLDAACQQQPKATHTMRYHKHMFIVCGSRLLSKYHLYHNTSVCLEWWDVPHFMGPTSICLTQRVMFINTKQVICVIVQYVIIRCVHTNANCRCGTWWCTIRVGRHEVVIRSKLSWCRHDVVL